MKPTAKIPPKPGKETIYIDVDDEITSIIDKVDGAKQKVVALVLPKRATVLQSVVNMRLLKRSSEKASKNVVLITSEDALLPLAGAAGIHVAKNLTTKPVIPTAPGAAASEVAKEGAEELDDETEEGPTKLDYHRTVGELAANHGAEEEAIALEDEDAEEEKPKSTKAKPAKDKKLKVPNFDRFRLLVFGGIAAFILLVVFLVLAIFILPKATIDITTGSTPVSANLTLNASSAFKTLDESANNIPAVSKTTNQTSTQSVPATGQQNNGTQATGQVYMTAQECAPDIAPPSTVPAGTGLSAGGLTYISQNDTEFGYTSAKGSCVNYAATASTNITAQAGGTNYNTGSGTSFTVDGRSDVSASGSAAGGTDDMITVVSQSDLNNAATKLSSASSSSFTSTFESQLASQGLYVLTSTLKAAAPTTTASPAVGQQASSTTVTTTISYSVLAVEKSDLSKALMDNLNSQIDQGKEKLTNSNVLAGASVSVQNQISATAATLSVSESTTAIPTLNITSIKNQSVGEKAGVITSSISNLPGVKNVTVKLSPFWISKAPKASKIKVVQQQVSGSGG